MNENNKKLTIEGKNILGEVLKNECTIFVDDFINLDNLTISSSDINEDFIKDHCPLKIVDLDDKLLILEELKSGNKIELEKGEETFYLFKDKNFKLTYLQ